MDSEYRYRRFMAEKEIANGIVDVKKKQLEDYFELHWHDFFEITYYFEGRGKNIINGKEYDVVPGFAVFLTPTDYHEITVDEPMNEMTLMINQDILPDEVVSNTVSGDEAIYCVFRGEEKKEIESLLAMLMEEFTENAEYSPVCQKNLVGLLVARILRKYESDFGHKCGESGKLVGKNERIFKRAMSYILVHFTENPSLSEISKYLGYSPCYFSRHFHAISGVSYKEYIRKLRLNHAKRLLLSSDMSVAEVGRVSGYGTLQVFLSDFKKKYGETPTSFRKRYISKGKKDN